MNLLEVYKNKMCDYSNPTLEEACRDQDFGEWIVFQEKKKTIAQISKILEKKSKEGEMIVPLQENVFNIFQRIPNPKFIRVVIFGQDPYIKIDNGKPQAQGYSFGVAPNQKIPPSLRNIFQEISNEYPDYEIPENGCLMDWINQGVFLLNACLTCKYDNSNSHGKIGFWNGFVRDVIEEINTANPNVIYVLWGNESQKKFEPFLERKKEEFILKSAHPSPLSAHKGFFGNNHFKKINQILKKIGEEEIIW